MRKSSGRALWKDRKNAGKPGRKDPSYTDREKPSDPAAIGNIHLYPSES